MGGLGSPANPLVPIERIALSRPFERRFLKPLRLLFRQIGQFVEVRRVELLRSFERWNLNPVRLPIPPHLLSFSTGRES
jgi:hypothetical protein